MNSSIATRSLNISNCLILVAWVLFAIALVLPAGNYNLISFNFGVGGPDSGSHFPMIGLQILMISFCLSPLLPFLPFFFMGGTGKNDEAAYLLALLIYLGTVFSLTLATLMSDKDSTKYGRTPVASVLSGLIVFAPIFMAALTDSPGNSSIEFVGLHYIAYGAICFFISLIPSSSENTALHIAWLICILALANFAVFYTGSNTSPAFTAWCLSLACLAVGKLIQLRNFSPIST